MFENVTTERIAEAQNATPMKDLKGVVRRQ